EAAEAISRIASPDEFHLAFLAACFAMAGDRTRAGEQARAILAKKPGFSVDKDYVPTLHYKRAEDLAHHREALLTAGLPA
ncbi:MAG TPA: hypothetical protein VFC18_15215, partial [Burkholderiales bacterium]|nr:hypothetical protein [Burkholderiales bacterium]